MSRLYGVNASEGTLFVAFMSTLLIVGVGLFIWLRRREARLKKSAQQSKVV